MADSDKSKTAPDGHDDGVSATAEAPIHGPGSETNTFRDDEIRLEDEQQNLRPRSRGQLSPWILWPIGIVLALLVGFFVGKMVVDLVSSDAPETELVSTESVTSDGEALPSGRPPLGERPWALESQKAGGD